MKNIHVLPTDKPSRLFKFANQLHLDTIPKEYYKKYNIYITSDEEIKEGDWFLWQGYGGEWFKEKCEYMLYEGKKTKHLNCHYKTQFKVILTTDLQLIADGIQAIDDEFLEWFVKNPNCESVAVKQELGVCLNCEWNYDSCPNTEECLKDNYKIIIPKEEAKQELPIINGSYGCTIQTKKEEPKQETLEEVGERWNEKQTTLEFGKPYNAPNRIKAFIEGAKSDAARDYWFEKFQQEQCNKMFSDEDILDAWELGAKEGLPLTREKKEKLFRQFKKK